MSERVGGWMNENGEGGGKGRGERKKEMAGLTYDKFAENILNGLSGRRGLACLSWNLKKS